MLDTHVIMRVRRNAGTVLVTPSGVAPRHRRSEMQDESTFDSLPAQVKSCRVCGLLKRYADFYMRPDSPDGRRSECKVCTKARSTTSQRSRQQERKAYLKQYHSDHRELLNAKVRERKKRTRRYLYFRRYRAANLDRLRDTERRWRQRNRHQEAARRHARRALPLNAETRDYIRLLQSDPCSYCGAATGTIDHIVPVVKGGSNHWSNLTSACLSCNSSKHDRSLLVFLMERTHAS